MFPLKMHSKQQKLEKKRFFSFPFESLINLKCFDTRYACVAQCVFAAASFNHFMVSVEHWFNKMIRSSVFQFMDLIVQINFSLIQISNPSSIEADTLYPRHCCLDPLGLDLNAITAFSTLSLSSSMMISMAYAARINIF